MLNDVNIVDNVIKNIVIDDTTLRDGEQTPGLAFSFEEKMNIIKMLDNVGVEEIEAGIPSMGHKEMKEFEKLMSLGVKSRLIAWCRGVNEDIQRSIDAGAEAVEISLPVSDIQINSKLKKSRKWVLDQLKRCLDFCADKDVYVSVGGEDASRADEKFLYQYCDVIKNYGGMRFRYCDTVGILEPIKTYMNIKRLVDNTGVDIEIHTHNDFGMATGNALAAVQAGARYINTTVMGLGERAGNAPLEEIIMALKHVLNIEVNYNTKRLKDVASYVSKSTGRKIEPQKPILGRLMFTHESGIHVDGVLKDPKNYEPFDPSEVGQKRRFVIGAHSGRSALRYKLMCMGISAEDCTIDMMMAEIKSTAVSLKRNLQNKEIGLIYDKYKC